MSETQTGNASSTADSSQVSNSQSNQQQTPTSTSGNVATTSTQTPEAKGNGSEEKQVSQSIKDIYQRQQQELARKKQENQQQRQQAIQGDTLVNPIDTTPYQPAKETKFNPQEYMNALLPPVNNKEIIQQDVTSQVDPELASQGVNWEMGFPRFMDGSIVPPPTDNDPAFNDFLQWTLENPHHYARYQQELSKQAYRQEVEAYQRQQQETLIQQERQREEEEAYNGYVNTLKEELKTNYHPILAESEDAFDALYECIEQIAPYLPTDDQGRFYNVAEDRPMTEKDLVNIGFTRLKEYYDILQPVFNQIGKLNTPMPANQFMTQGGSNQGSSSRLASGDNNDIGEQIRQARLSGNNELARQLQRRHMFPHLFNQS